MLQQLLNQASAVRGQATAQSSDKYAVETLDEVYAIMAVTTVTKNSTYACCRPDGNKFHGSHRALLS